MSVAYEQQASTALGSLGLAVAEQQLDQAAQQAAASGWSYTHFLGYLLDAELRFRHEKTVRLNLQFANLPYQKRLDSFEFHEQPSIDKRLIDELATGRFLHEGRNVVFLGRQEWVKRISPSRWVCSLPKWDIESTSPPPSTWLAAWPAPWPKIASRARSRISPGPSC